MCYECSRGSLHGKQLLIDDYFDLDYDESAQRAISHEHEDCGSNTTFLGLSIRLKLQSVSFFIREEFSQAKTGFDCVWILSDVLDRTYRVYCPRLCQITYLLNDPYLTVIASCQSGSWTGIVYDNQFALSTCSEDLCNSFARKLGVLTRYTYFQLIKRVHRRRLQPQI